MAYFSSLIDTAIVTVLKGHVTHISVDRIGCRRETKYAHGGERDCISVCMDDGSHHQLFKRSGAAYVWEASDLMAQARQIARMGDCSVIDDAEVEAWSVKAQVKAASDYADAMMEVASARAEENAWEQVEKEGVAEITK